MASKLTRERWQTLVRAASRAALELQHAVAEEEPSVAWCCCAGVLTVVTSALQMIADLGFPGDDDGPSLTPEGGS